MMRGMTKRLPLLVMLLSGVAQAKGPKLTAAAAALLAKGPVLVLPDDNLVLPVPPAGKPVPLCEPPPQRISRVAGAPTLLLIDDDLVAVRGTSFAKLAYRPGAMPAATPDGTVVAGVEEKKFLKITRAGIGKRVPFQRDGRFELEHPYVTPDGKRAMVALRDYTQTLDDFYFLIVDVDTLAFKEINLSKSFVPGALRQPLSATQVALQMFAQHADGDSVTLVPSDVVVLDLATRKLSPAPHELRPGRPSPSGKRSLLEGPMSYSDDKSCGADETLLYDERRPKPSHREAGPGTVVTLLDFLDDDTLLGAVLTLKGCKLQGVAIPIDAESPSKWKPLPLPTRAGRPTAFVLGKR